MVVNIPEAVRMQSRACMGCNKYTLDAIRIYLFIYFFFSNPVSGNVNDAFETISVRGEVCIMRR
jgi:hypothetical protein